MDKNLRYAVTGQRIELTEPVMLVAGTVNVYTVSFSFDGAWDGFRRTAVFSSKDNTTSITREQMLEDDACRVPWEVLFPGAYLKVGVYGTKDGSRLPTIWTERRLYINPGAGPTQEAEDPSPVLAEQILQRMGDLDALKTEDKSSLVAAINEVWSSGGGSGTEIDDTLTVSGKAADAAAVGARLSSLSKDKEDKSVTRLIRDILKKAVFTEDVKELIAQLDASLTEAGVIQSGSVLSIKFGVNVAQNGNTLTIT